MLFQPMSTQYSWVPVHFMTPVSQGCDCIVLKKSVLREEDRQIGKKKKMITAASEWTGMTGTGLQ